MLNLIGTFRARAQDAQLTTSTNGTERVSLEFVVVEGEGQGERILWDGYLTEKSTEFTVKALRAMGWQGDDLADLSTVGTKDCNILTDEEEYKGKYKVKVKYVNELGGRGVALGEKLTPEQARAFAAKMRGLVIAAGGGKASPPATRPSPATRPISRATPEGTRAVLGSAQPAQHAQPAPPDFAPSDDDIPF